MILIKHICERAIFLAFITISDISVRRFCYCLRDPFYGNIGSAR